MSVALTSRQQRVYDALAAKAGPCANMYLGAIRVFADSENPERMPQAAHSFRELMEKIGPFLDVPVPDPRLRKGQGSLNEKFVSLEKLLEDAENNSGNCSNGKWSGVIHQRTAILLAEVRVIARWRKLNVELRKTKAQLVVAKFDPLHSALPAEIQELRASEWQSTQNYFVSVSHHGEAMAAEFQKWVLHLEVMLLGGLAPVAKESLNEIDAIIREGEGK